MIYTTYNPTTGQILSTVSVYGVDPISNLEGKSYIEGNYSEHDYYIENGQPVAKTRAPNTPTAKYDFDYGTKTWVLNTERSIQAVKDIRDVLFQSIDRMNPMWYASLTTEQQQELQTYRQALLDITDQPGYPTDIQWPAKPTWL